MICFYLQLTYHVYVKREHATAANTNREVVWSSLNNWEVTPVEWHCLSKKKVSKKASKAYTYTHFSLFSFSPTKRAACQVKPCPWPDIWQAYKKKLFAGLLAVSHKHRNAWHSWRLEYCSNKGYNPKSP